MAVKVLPTLLNALFQSCKVEGVPDLSAVVSDIFFRNLPYAVGSQLLGQKCQTRSLHDCASAMRACGISFPFLRSILHTHEDLIAQPASRLADVMIHAHSFERFVQEKSPLLTSPETARKLGFESGQFVRRHLSPLLETGVLRPVGGSGLKRDPHIYSEPELNAAIEAFLARFEKIDPTGMMSLVEVTRRYKVSALDLWSLLAVGKIKRLGVVKNLPFSKSIRVHVQDLLEGLTNIQDCHDLDGSA